MGAEESYGAEAAAAAPSRTGVTDVLIISAVWRKKDRIDQTTISRTLRAPSPTVRKKSGKKSRTKDMGISVGMFRGMCAISCRAIFACDHARVIERSRSCSAHA